MTNELDWPQRPPGRFLVCSRRRSVHRLPWEIFYLYRPWEKLQAAPVHRVSLTPRQVAVKKAAIREHQIPTVHDTLIHTQKRRNSFGLSQWENLNRRRQAGSSSGVSPLRSSVRPTIAVAVGEAIDQAVEVYLQLFQAGLRSFPVWRWCAVLRSRPFLLSQ